MQIGDVLNLLRSQNVRFVDFKFDASNFGYRTTESSDLVLTPDLCRAFMAPPSDHFFNMRNEIVETLKGAGVPVKYHHHERA